MIFTVKWRVVEKNVRLCDSLLSSRYAVSAPPCVQLRAEAAPGAPHGAERHPARQVQRAAVGGARGGQPARPVRRGRVKSETVVPVSRGAGEGGEREDMVACASMVASRVVQRALTFGRVVAAR